MESASTTGLDASPAVGVVLPGDNRTPVRDTSKAPFVCVGQVSTTFQQGGGIGTGTLLDEYHILTCAHNFYNTTRGHATQVQFTPALTRDDKGKLVRPFPPMQLAKWALPDSYVKAPAPLPPVDGVMVRDITKYLFDYAVGRLAQPVDIATVFQCVGLPSPFDGTDCAIMGYSGDLDTTGCTQYQRYGKATLDSTRDFVTYTMSTYNGDSGAAVWYQPRDRPFANVVAVHVSGCAAVGHDAGFNFGPALPDPGIIQRLIAASD